MPIVMLVSHVFLQDLPLPKPTGSYEVGAWSLQWTDIERDERATEDPYDKRQVLLKLYYPTADTKGTRASYYNDPDAYAPIWDQSDIDLIKRVKTNAIANAKPYPQRSGFPLILLSHGWQGSHASLTIISEELASHGYVIAALDHPYMGHIALSSDVVTEATEKQFHSYDEVMQFYAADLDFVIAQLIKWTEQPDSAFVHHIDFTRVIAVGHSSGFLAARGLALRNRSVSCMVNIDAPGVENSELATYQTKIINIRTERLKPIDASFLDQHRNIKQINIPNASHGSVTDWDYLTAKSEAQREHALMLVRQIAQAILDY